MLDKIKILITAIGCGLSYLVGGFDNTIIFLCIAMSLDYITGVIYAWHTKTVSSKTGFIGIIKKVLILFIIVVANQIDLATNMVEPIFRTTVCWFFIANECISLLENCSNIGLPIPKKLQDALEQIKGNEGLENE